MLRAGRVKLVSRVEDTGNSDRVTLKCPALRAVHFTRSSPTSFAKYFQMLSNIHSARMYAAQALFANELWDGED